MKQRNVWRRKSTLPMVFFLMFAMLIGAMTPYSVKAAPADAVPELSCKAAVLMEASTGRILYEKNQDEALPPASVTKIMTLLLVMEEIEAGRLKLDDPITASAHACSMGGSQIYLKEGEVMSAEDMIKSVVIASANDAAVALAEHVAGSEESFVARMNARAAELGMVNTHFENTNGLDDTAKDHVISAKDIAIMSRALIRYEKITQYSSIWMDTVRDGAFGLTNTNRLVRFYRGATGLKTGSTAKAGFCISATATRDGMTLIAVIMGSESRDIRNRAATVLLDWGFSSFGVYSVAASETQPIPVRGGVSEVCVGKIPAFSTVIPKGASSRVERSVILPESIDAPIEKGTELGEVRYTLDGEEIGSVKITASVGVDRIGFWEVARRILACVTIS